MSIGLSFSNPIIFLYLILKINLSHQDPIYYHVSNTFQDLSIFKITQPNNFKFLILNQKSKISLYILNCSNL